MRKFSSYGQIDTESHYYAPRTALIEGAYTQLIGENPVKGGHDITVWAPRQTGKSSVMLEAVKKLRQHDEFEVVIITMQSAKNAHTAEDAVKLFHDELQRHLRRQLPQISSWKEIPALFTAELFPKPLILIIDEFDAFDESSINSLANEFRQIYTTRQSEKDTPTSEKTYRLHGLALIGVRSVLGIENASGSPFNVQRSLHIPNLSHEEVHGIFRWYVEESGQQIETAVIDRLYEETQGQPGLVCWLGELLTETYNEVPDKPIDMKLFEYVFMWATRGLPSNNIFNIISKARQLPYKQTVLELFRTEEKIEFDFDKRDLNFLYMNGVIDIEATQDNLYVKFPSPMVQKRLFSYFSHELFEYMGKLFEPFADLSDTLTEQELMLKGLLGHYQKYLQINKEWLFKQAPRRADLRIYEAIYHFNLYMYLHKFLQNKGGRVWPEFPTGNGKIDILISYREQLYGIEV
ncbi:MAG: hypothetical protein GY801_47535, partial [bacterium]|nr:hypothetical protein [bacterium]